MKIFLIAASEPLRFAGGFALPITPHYCLKITGLARGKAHLQQTNRDKNWIWQPRCDL